MMVRTQELLLGLKGLSRMREKMNAQTINALEIVMVILYTLGRLFASAMVVFMQGRHYKRLEGVPDSLGNHYWIWVQHQIQEPECSM